MSESFNWQTRPIFISSTFKDMGAERDYLRQNVFPELEERLRERRCHLEPIDLRWGVETINLDEERSKEILVLKVCLGEIQRSKPYLIALIGDRYGWIPPTDRMENAAMEAGFKGSLGKKSITALELEYGVLNNPEQQIRSFFYLREPLPYDLMAPEIAADYCDKYNSDSHAAVAARNLDGLKEQLRKEKKLEGRIKSYPAVWDKENNRVTGLDTFGKMVLEDLWSDLKDETDEYMHQPAIEWEELERQMLEEFIEARSINFAGRGKLISEIMDHILNQESNNKGSAICITGTAGSGKSAVFAYLFRQLENKKIIMLANSAGAGLRSDNINDVLMRWIGELTEKQNISNPLPENPSTEDVDAVFQDLLAGACKNNRVVILMDALNQMGKSTRTSYMQWLPEYLPAGCRMIVTGIPCMATNILLKKEWAINLELPRLEKSDAEEIALSICSRYHRTLNQEVLALLLNKELEKDLPASSNPLWMNMAVEELNLLDMDAFSLAERKYNGNSEQRLHQLLLDTVSDMPPGAEELYRWIFNRAEKVYGRSLVENCLSLIAVSRKGWRESDLQSVVPRLTGSPWNELSFSGLKRTLRAHLTCLGNYLLTNFAHSQMRKAVIESYLIDEKKVERLHMQVEIHLMSSPGDPIASSERMYHLICLKNIPEIAEFYGGMFSHNENKDSDRTLAEFIYSGPTEELDDRIKFALEILQEPSLMITRKIRIIGKYLHNLPTAIGFHLDLKSKRKYFEAILHFLEEQVRIYPEIDILRFYRSLCHKEIGNILLTSGDLNGALNSFVASQQISESLLLTDPENRTLKWRLSQSLIYIGEVLYEKADLEGALKAQNASLVIAESLLLSDPGECSWQRHLALVHVNIGATFRALGNKLAAEKSYRTSLEITESCYQDNPGNTDIRHDLMQCHGHLGEILVEVGNLTEGLDECQKSIEFAEAIAGIYPGDLNIQRDLSVSYEKLGDVMYEIGNLQEALEAYRKSKVIAELNVSSDPANIIWLVDLVMNLEKTGKVLEATGDNMGSLQVYQASLKIRKELFLTNPDKPGLQKDLAANYRKIGDTMLKSGELLNAQEAFYKSLNIIKSLSGTDPANLELQVDLALANYRVGFALSRTFVSEANNYYSNCLDMLHSLEAKGLNLEPFVISLMKELENKIR